MHHSPETPGAGYNNSKTYCDFKNKTLVKMMDENPSNIIILIFHI